ncbi:hypothetical protein ACWD6Z_34785, partial [Streptomyces californicus]
AALVARLRPVLVPGLVGGRGTPRISGLRVGFVSTNGYILAFRRYFGETPGAYVKRSASRTAA